MTYIYMEERNPLNFRFLSPKNFCKLLCYPSRILVHQTWNPKPISAEQYCNYKWRILQLQVGIKPMSTVQYPHGGLKFTTLSHSLRWSHLQQRIYPCQNNQLSLIFFFPVGRAESSNFEAKFVKLPQKRITRHMHLKMEKPFKWVNFYYYFFVQHLLLGQLQRNLKKVIHLGKRVSLGKKFFFSFSLIMT